MCFEGLSQADEPRGSAGVATPDSDPKNTFLRDTETLIHRGIFDR